MTYSPSPLPTQATREHVTPRSLSGDSAQRNIVVACLRCNNARAQDLDWVPFVLLPNKHKTTGVPVKYNPINGSYLHALAGTKWNDEWMTKMKER